MPAPEVFGRSADWSIEVDGEVDTDRDAFLRISARGDVARLFSGVNLRSTGALVVGLAVTLGIGIQFIPPVTPTATLPGDSAMTEVLAVPEPVETIVRNACYDCHSPETRWPWYARVAPVSWYVARDVQHGRSNLDFSRWSTDPDREPTPLQRLRWMCEDVLDGTMPPRLYRLAHPEARLGEEEKRLLCAWTAIVRRDLQER